MSKSLSERLLARSNPNSDGHPANKTAQIDVASVNGRVRYAFGTIINARLPEGMKDTKLAKGIRMLWPHMSKDLEKVPEPSLARGAMFVTLLMQMCIQGVPEGIAMTFEAYLDAVMTGQLHVAPGELRLLSETVAEAVESV